MKAGDIILLQGTGLLSDSINFLTRGSYSHSAIVTSSDTIVEAIAEGVVERPIPAEYKCYGVYELIGITSEERTKIVDYARAQVGVPYDYVHDLGFAINAVRKFLGLPVIANLLNNPKAVICSTLVDLAYAKAGIDLREDLKPGDITPMGIAYSPKVHLIENHNLWEI